MKNIKKIAGKYFWKFRIPIDQENIYYNEIKMDNGFINSEYLYYYPHKVIVEPKFGLAILGLRYVIIHTSFYRSLMPSIISIMNPLKKIYKTSNAIIFDYNVGLNYYHLFVDVLPKIFLLARYNLNSNELLISERIYDSAPFNYIISHTKIFNEFTFNIIPSNVYVKSKGVYYARPLVDSKESVASLRRNIIKIDKIDKIDKNYERVFVNRRKDSGRYLSNYDSVVHILKKYGIKTIYLEDECIDSQINIFSRATLIIGIHGAGLTNIIWTLSSKAALIELMPNNRVADHYERLSKCLGLEYFSLFCTDLDQVGIYPEGKFECSAVQLEESIREVIGLNY